MSLRLLGFILTSLAVVVLLGSLVAGLRGPPLEDGWQSVPVDRVAGGHEDIRVEVLNGAGIASLARDVTDRLRGEGFDVVYYGNAGRLATDSTTILDRTDNPAAVAAVAAALGIDRDRIVVAIDTSLYLEATVILAPDRRFSGSPFGGDLPDVRNHRFYSLEGRPGSRFPRFFQGNGTPAELAGYAGYCRDVPCAFSAGSAREKPSKPSPGPVPWICVNS